MHLTIADRMVLTRGRATGFDYLRIGLAVAVVIWHTVLISYGEPMAAAALANPMSRPLIYSILPLFFALSGFLVAGSLERAPGLTTFLGLRVIRIVPALVVETLLSAFILGPLLTSLPLADYFKHHEFRSYLLNMLGDPHFLLPGMFPNNPCPRTVNGQLWTVPFELSCYILLAGLALVGIAKRRVLLFWCAAALQCTLAVQKVLEAHGHYSFRPGMIDGSQLVMTFLAGVVLYAIREQLAYSRWLFVGSLGLTLLAPDVPLGEYLIAFPAAYVTVWLGLRNPPANALHQLGDLSYGVFLYGFPLQQVVAMWGDWTHHWYVNLAIALSVATGFAWLSWTLVEKNALALRRYFPRYAATRAEAIHVPTSA